MASGWTNKGKYGWANLVCKNATEPTYFYIALVTSATTPTADTNTLSQLTEVTSANGYTTGGVQVTRDATGFDTITENDTDDRLEIKLKDIVWTASGGNIASARWAVMTDDNATVGSREVWAWWDLTQDRTTYSGETFTLVDLELRVT